MKMTAFVAALVVAVATSAFAAEPSSSSLSKMGLAGVTKMTDAQGQQVRGMGSIVAVGGATLVGTSSGHSGAVAGSFYLGAAISSHVTLWAGGLSTSSVGAGHGSASASTTSSVGIGH